MFCSHCSKLAILNAIRICVRCQGHITNNISCICDKCSKDQNICSICLKKISSGIGKNGNGLRRGCRCGGK
jgi:hypothetical protein